MPTKQFCAAKWWHVYYLALCIYEYIERFAFRLRCPRWGTDRLNINGQTLALMRLGKSRKSTEGVLNGQTVIWICKTYRFVNVFEFWILCQNYMMFQLVLYPPPLSFEPVCCFVCGRRRVAVARYWMMSCSSSINGIWNLWINNSKEGVWTFIEIYVQIFQTRYMDVLMEVHVLVAPGKVPLVSLRFVVRPATRVWVRIRIPTTQGMST